MNDWHKALTEWHKTSEAADAPLPPYEENGRLYHGNFRGVYPLPCDAYECTRLHLLHKTIRIARQVAGIPGGPFTINPAKQDYRELHAVPFDGSFWADPERPRILDLGCGTGIWALEMARWYRDITVVGIDIVNIYPDYKECPAFPTNCVFQKGAVNFETPWGTSADYWSFIRAGLLCGTVTDWSAFYKKIYYHLKPGSGLFEQVEIDLEPRCDDDSLPQDPEYPLNKWYSMLTNATADTGRPMAYNGKTKQLLESVGFVNVEDYTVKLPLIWNDDWPSTKHGIRLATRYYACLVGDERHGAHRDSGLESMSLATFTRELGWTLQQWIDFENQIKKEFTRSDVRAYNVLSDMKYPTISSDNVLRLLEYH